MRTRFIVAYFLVIAASLWVTRIGKGQFPDPRSLTFLPLIRHHTPGSIPPTRAPIPTRTLTPTPAPTPTATPISSRPLVDVVIRGTDVPADWEVVVDKHMPGVPEAYDASYRTPWNNTRISYARFRASTYSTAVDAIAQAEAECRFRSDRAPTLPDIGDYGCFAVAQLDGYLFAVKDRTILLTMFRFVEQSNFDEAIFFQCDNRMIARLNFQEIGGCNMHDYD